ncbi:alpha/beta hydrolase fold domain-containing protein, partial [Streptomyces sp. NRRL S-495]|uniref:alpha/beta hydrolase fold domain-containing protein n=1 Tax=Streptomyces sp. NRRL S-495 TaxID=1609133 RepID=UPI000698DC46
MDQELGLALDAVPMTPNGAFDLTDLATTRAAFRAQAESAADSSPADPSVTVEELLASRANGTGRAGQAGGPDGPDGHEVQVPVRLLRPTTATGPLPVLVWFHGGGQVLGFAAQDEPWLTKLAASLGCAIAAVDYRLAPETPAPGAAEDGFTAYQWLCQEADALDLDGTRIGIAGQSGGGGIAAATALMVRDRGGVAPLFQSLTYPMLDDRNRTASSHEITDIGIWDRSTNLLAWQAILGDRAGTEDVCPYAAPARAADLADLPPTFITVG